MDQVDQGDQVGLPQILLEDREITELKRRITEEFRKDENVMSTILLLLEDLKRNLMMMLPGIAVQNPDGVAKFHECRGGMIYINAFVSTLISCQPTENSDG